MRPFISRPRLRFPDAAEVESLFRDAESAGISYHPKGCSLRGGAPGFTVDENSICLGRGDTVFRAAVGALFEWKMFPSEWVRIIPRRADVTENDVVLVIVHVFRLWWVNACRVVYSVDEVSADGSERRRGFAYGTLPTHFEQGEELFAIEQRSDETVWYTIRAVSRPNYLSIWLAYPVTRYFQRRFAADSKESMRRAVS